jgi:dissimilatory sulfite reductase (desulfoviridin) alpha/beta subunit
MREINMNEIKDKELKLQGFIRQKDRSHFVVRVKTQVGNVSSEQMTALSEITRKYGRGYIYLTNRLNIIVPWIAQEHLNDVREAMEKAGMVVGGTGPTVRPIVACVGTICDHGMADTLLLGRMLDEKFFGRRLPAKLKIGITGCPNDCAKVEINDIGFMGKRSVKASADVEGTCYAMYLGGMFGRAHRVGGRAGPLLSPEEAVTVTEKVIDYMEHNAMPGERLGNLIDRVGMDEFLKAIGLSS